MEEKKAPIKKKPGRPRKTPLKKRMKREGISATPINAANDMEMIYDMPSVFKKIFALCKTMAVGDLSISFDRKQVKISAVDHYKKSHISIVIHGSKINHYYCKKPTVINLNPKNMEKIIQILNKNYISVAFVLKTVTSKSSLTIIFKNSIKIDECREIDLIQNTNPPPNVSFDVMNYPIKFRLPGKYFKKIINDISLFSDVLTISKVGNSPLLFKYTSEDKTVKSTYIVKCEKSINLHAAVCDSDIFSTSVNIAYVKPLSSTLISEYMEICADTRKNMIFKTSIDEGTVDIMVSTDIVRE